MVYVSATLVAPGMKGFSYLKHKNAPFNVYLILDVDPQSIFVCSPNNISSPYAREPSEDPIGSMLTFLKQNLKKNILNSYIFYKLQHLGIIPMTCDAPNMSIFTGIRQLKTNTSEGDHNEVIFIGNQLAKVPNKVVALAVDASELEATKDHSQYHALIDVLNNCNLPIVLLDLEKKLGPNYHNSFSTRLQNSANNSVTSNKKLINLLCKMQRLHDSGQENHSVESDSDQLKAEMKETDQLYSGLLDEEEHVR